MFAGKYFPEVFAVHLLSELTRTLPHGDPAWLDALRHYAVVTVLCRMADDHLQVRERERERVLPGFFPHQT